MLRFFPSRGKLYPPLKNISLKTSTRTILCGSRVDNRCHLLVPQLELTPSMFGTQVIQALLIPRRLLWKVSLLVSAYGISVQTVVSVSLCRGCLSGFECQLLGTLVVQEYVVMNDGSGNRSSSGSGFLPSVVCPGPRTINQTYTSFCKF